MPFQINMLFNFFSVLTLSSYLLKAPLFSPCLFLLWDGQTSAANHRYLAETSDSEHSSLIMQQKEEPASDETDYKSPLI